MPNSPLPVPKRERAESPTARIPDADAYFTGVFETFREHVNPYLAEYLAFAGFGVEVYGEGCCSTLQAITRTRIVRSTTGDGSPPVG